MVAQLVERSLLTPEICGSNPNTSKFYLPIEHLKRKDKNKEKEAGNVPPLKNSTFHHYFETLQSNIKAVLELRVSFQLSRTLVETPTQWPISLLVIDILKAF